MSSLDPFSGRHLLLVGTGGVKRRRVLASLRALGLRRVTCLNDAVNWAEPYVDDWILADPVRPLDSTVALVHERIGRPDAVYTYDDYSVILAAHLASAFGLPGADVHAVASAKDKDAFRRVCRARALAAPRSWRVDPAAPGPVPPDFAFPAVVKPTHGAGSVLVRRVEDAGALARTLTDHAAALASEPAAALWPDRSVLIEEYVAGDEVDVDVLLQDGELRYAAVSDNRPPIEPYFLELGGRLPSALPESAQRELIDVAHRALLALGVRDGCVHFEARWTKRGAVPIEANLRLGGAEIYAFHLSAYGVDLVEQAVRIALGAPVTVHMPSEPLAYVASTAFIPSRSGRIRRIAPEPWVEAHPALAELCLFRSAGDTVRIPPEGFDYVGWMVARARSADAAEARLEELAAGVHVEIESDPPSNDHSGEQP